MLQTRESMYVRGGWEKLPVKTYKGQGPRMVMWVLRKKKEGGGGIFHVKGCPPPFLPLAR